MTTTIDLTTLTFPNLKMRPTDAGRLRGYFAKAFGERSILFHNHTAEGGFRYAYSKVQYKVIGGVPTVVGVAEGAALVMEAFADLSEIVLAGRTVPINDKELRVDRVEAGVLSDLQEYKFTSPCWMFNQENYAEYQSLTEGERPAYLNKLLRSHIIAALRGIGCPATRDEPIMVLPRLQPRLINAKNQRMQMYFGTFTANVAIPPGIGIAKSTSKGYGTVLPV